ncbi:uncharacterized protein DNG_01377 [Cephalotrichum gorgonifer]|uniref:RNase MRP protein 1 RNA binding domain-containing protein n=1 Tax=Cephalotrichum gorgonifer TaxID=2041049 RepID=A0AAE8MSH0_9PEZI|nr:uncharacterized protein DNG_01377 [Cephalotrichum gorgonifer]
MHLATDLAADLAPISALLDAFNHRNKNQHRRTAWWGHFNLLRRAVRRLSSPNSPGNRAPRGQGGGASRDALARRARWVAEYVIPPSYRSFSQLTADNQYAPLGLVLLGTLARFNSIISSLLPSDPGPTPAPRLQLTAVAERSRAGNRAPSPAPTPEHQMDLGVAISRDEFLAPTVSRRTPDVRDKLKGVVSLDGDAKSTSVRRKPAAKATPPGADSSVSVLVTRDNDKDKVKKKKKKKKIGGTDLSDLFDSIT